MENYMKKEFQSFMDKKTWVMVHLSPYKKTIGYKWLFKVKLKNDSTFDKYKSSIMEKGYRQRYNIDYSETFSPVVTHQIVCVVLTLTLAFN